MTLSTASGTFGSARRASTAGMKAGMAIFNNLGIYHFCVAFVVVDFLDILDLLDFSRSNNIVKYGYAAIVIGFMAVYFLRWRRIDPTLAPILYLLFFVITGLVFAINFFFYDERESYISAFIAPLVFSLSIFIPPNSVIIDTGKITRGLTLLFSVGSVFYLIEAIVKPLDIVRGLTPLHEVQVHKSIICVLALCLCILTRRNILGIFIAAVTVAALLLRPLSTLVLALACCLPIAFALRFRVVKPRPMPVLIAYAVAMTTLLCALSIPLLLYFFFDDVSAIISSWESYLKADVIGGQSNMDFRLAILQFAFSQFDTTSFWYGSGLSGAHTVALGQLPGWEWWFYVNGGGDASIHSDFVIVLVLSGIIGYAAFSIALYLTLRDRFRILKLQSVKGNSAVLQSIALVALVALLVYCSDQPWLSYYDHANSVWMLLLISEIVKKAKVVGNATGKSYLINRIASAALFRKPAL
jgi:drug/metabolite transporter (DMT)-like permease